MLSPTKKLIKEKIEKILNELKENNEIQNYMIQGNTVMIITNMSEKEKNQFDSIFTTKLYHDLLPEYKEGKIANMPLIFTSLTETGLKIEF